MVSAGFGLCGNDAAAATNRVGSFATVWYDPINLKLSEVHSSISASFDGGGGLLGYSCNDYRAGHLGWYETDHDLNCPSGWNYATASTWDTMYDNVFCGVSGGTWTYYNRNNVSASLSGGLVGWTGQTYSVGCDAGILWYDTYLEPGVYY